MSVDRNRFMPTKNLHNEVSFLFIAPQTFLNCTMHLS